MCMAFGLISRILFLVFLYQTLANLLILSSLILLCQMPLQIDIALLWVFTFPFSIWHRVISKWKISMARQEAPKLCPSTAPPSSVPAKGRSQPGLMQMQMSVGPRGFSVAFQLTLGDVVYVLVHLVLWSQHMTLLRSPCRLRLPLPFRITGCCTASVISSYRDRYMMFSGVPECVVTGSCKSIPSVQQLQGPISSC